MFRDSYVADGLSSATNRLLIELLSEIRYFGDDKDITQIMRLGEEIYTLLSISYPSIAARFLDILDNIRDSYDEQQEPDTDLIATLLYDFVSRKQEQDIWFHQFVREDWDLRGVDTSFLTLSDFVPELLDDYYEEEYAHSEELRKYDDLESSARSELIKQRLDSLIEYVGKFRTPVQRDALMSAIPGCNAGLIDRACATGLIINYIGAYYYSQNINFTKQELTQLKRELDTILDDHDVHHIDEAYNIFVNEYPMMLQKVYVQNSGQLFSVLRFLFPERYNYSRPFISLRSVKIPSTSERVLAYLHGAKEISIERVMAFVREKNLIYSRIIDVVNSLNERYLMKDRYGLIAISDTGITETICKRVSQMITNELSSSEIKAIRDLRCQTLFPKVKLQWNEWLIYSMLKKYEIGVTVTTTPGQLSKIIPVVTRRKSITKTEMEEFTRNHYYAPEPISIPSLDDMDSIDDYIEDELDDEWGSEIIDDLFDMESEMDGLDFSEDAKGEFEDDFDVDLDDDYYDTEDESYE